RGPGGGRGGAREPGGDGGGRCSPPPRRSNAGTAITCVPRLVASLSANGTPPIGNAVWADTRVHLPRGPVVTYRHAFTGARIEPRTDGEAVTVPAAALFDEFPVALLVPARR